MRLRKKTLIIISVTIVSMIAILYATYEAILLNSFRQLEEQDTQENLARALSALSTDLANLDLLVYDWAAWDDTYDFIVDLNEDYIESNLLDETFIGYEMNLMLFANSTGGIVFSKFFDLENEEEIPVPESFLEHLSPNNVLLQHLNTESSVTGIVLLSEDPLLIASHPILTSEEKGPILGTLIMGYYLDSSQITSLAETTHLSLNVHPVNDVQMPSDFQRALSSLTEEEPIFIEPLSADSVAGYVLLNDIYGEPSLVLRADMSRDIYMYGQASFFNLVLSLLVTSLVCGVMFALLLESMVLSRLTELSTQVKSVGKSGDLSMRVSMEGNDELSDLSGETNKMLSALEKSQSKIRRYSEHLEELVEERTMKLKEAHEHLLKVERLAAIGELAAMVGHDLRNPLTGIAGAVYYLKTKIAPKMDRKAREMLEIIEKDVEYSNKIVNDLQEYSRETRLELAETTPKLIMMEALSSTVVPKNIQVVDATQSEPKIKVDVEKMKRVFINTIKNAIDAMPKGGKLTVRSKEVNGNSEIAFTDTGAGIPSDVLAEIWKPLFTTKEKGMGLGLSICKRIAEAHGGTISVKSTVGRGTTFTVTLPIDPELEGGETVWLNEPESLLSTTTKA